MEKDSYNDEEEAIGKLTGDFSEQLKMKQQLVDDDDYDDGAEQEDGGDGDDEENDEEEEFSFARGEHAPPVTAEEIFYNGQIRPLFPLFNQKLLLSEDELEKMKERTPVKSVFIQAEDCPVSTSPENQEISGPYCEWSKNNDSNKAIEASHREICKKSNSTGFSKIWRFKEFLHRSNSDGRDAFVFFNDRKNETPTTTSENQDSYEVKVKVKVNDNAVTNKKMKKKKKEEVVVKKSEGVLAHEAYMKSKAKHDGRLRSQLPYRPELVGFFTNVNGGLTRNVHPF